MVLLSRSPLFPISHDLRIVAYTAPPFPPPSAGPCLYLALNGNDSSADASVVIRRGMPIGRIMKRDGVSMAERKGPNRALALCNIHDPARVPRGFAAHHVPDHCLAEGARCLVVA